MLYWEAGRHCRWYDHAHRPEHDHREVQEDHRAFSIQVMDRVVQIDPARVEADAMRRAVEDLMLLLFHGEIGVRPGALSCCRRCCRVLWGF